MPIKSFRDPITQRLKAWGFTETNAPGDLVREEPEGFNLDPRDNWEWNGSQWILTGSSVLETERIADMRVIAKDDLSVSTDVFTLVRAVVLTLIDELNIIRAAVPRGILSITRTGTVATVTTRDAHGLTTGDTVKVQGATLAAYNVQATVTVTNGTTFTYAVAGSPVTPAVGTLLYTMGAVPNMNPRTTTQARTAVLAKIDTGTVDS